MRGEQSEIGWWAPGSWSIMGMIGFISALTFTLSKMGAMASFEQKNNVIWLIFWKSALLNLLNTWDDARNYVKYSTCTILLIFTATFWERLYYYHLNFKKWGKQTRELEKRALRQRDVGQGAGGAPDFLTRKQEPATCALWALSWPHWTSSLATHLATFWRARCSSENETQPQLSGCRLRQGHFQFPAWLHLNFSFTCDPLRSKFILISTSPWNRWLGLWRHWLESKHVNIAYKMPLQTYRSIVRPRLVPVWPAHLQAAHLGTAKPNSRS